MTTLSIVSVKFICVVIVFLKTVYFDFFKFNEREDVQGGSETSNVVWVGDSGTDEKTGGGDGGGRVEDVAIFIRSDKNGQDQE